MNFVSSKLWCGTHFVKIKQKISVNFGAKCGHKSQKVAVLRIALKPQAKTLRQCHVEEIQEFKLPSRPATTSSCLGVTSLGKIARGQMRNRFFRKLRRRSCASIPETTHRTRVSKAARIASDTFKSSACLGTISICTLCPMSSNLGDTTQKATQVTNLLSMEQASG